MAIEHRAIADGERHEPKGIASASSGQVYTADGAAGGAWTDVPSPFAIEVIVKTASDFPAAVLGTRTLAANTVYTLDGHINIGSDTLALGSNTMIRGVDNTKTTITSTTSGVLFTATGTFTLAGFGVTCASGTIFDLTGSGASTAYESCYLKEFTINTAASLGTVHDWYSFFWDKGSASVFADGLDFSGTCRILILDLVEFTSIFASYNHAVDLTTATFDTCSFFRCGFGYTGANNHVVVAASGANLNSGKVGRISFCTFATISPAADAVLNYSVADINWRALDNVGLSSSVRAAQIYLHTQTDTTPLVSTVPEVINGSTNFVEGVADQFTTTSGGRLTYIGLTAATFSVTVGISGTSDAGTNVDINHWIYVNGTTKVTASKTRREYNSSAVGSPAPCLALIELEPNDYVELWVENDGGTQGWERHIINIKVTEVL